jgi:hypothetical protein
MNNKQRPKPKPSIGKIVLSLGGAYLAVLLSGGSIGTTYNTNSNACRSNSEYLDIEVVNRDRTSLPQVLESPDGNCQYAVSFNDASRSVYYAMDNTQRSKFRIRARRSGEFTSVYEIYSDDDLRYPRVSLNQYALNNTGRNKRCFVDNNSRSEYCFQQDIKLPAGKEYVLDLMVNSKGDILEVNEVFN